MNYDPYPIRFRPHERVMLKELARRLDRKESETVRVLVRGAYEALKKRDERENKNKTDVK
jgi:hypothetical protein